MTPDELNQCKAEWPGEYGNDWEFAIWASAWRVPLISFAERCMHEHEHSIFPPARIMAGEQALRLDGQGRIVAELPIVMDLEQLDITLKALTEIRRALEKAR